MRVHAGWLGREPAGDPVAGNLSGDTASGLFTPGAAAWKHKGSGEKPAAEPWPGKPPRPAGAARGWLSSSRVDFRPESLWGVNRFFHENFAMAYPHPPASTTDRLGEGAAR